MNDRDIWTIGHGGTPWADFVDQLRANGIQVVADVRALPGSKRSPQFDQDAMREALSEAGIDYEHLLGLTGRRRKQGVDEAINAGWQNASFRNYADYALSSQFREALEQLEELAATRRVAVLCGEPVPWRCHRLLLANALIAQGWTVHHIMGDRPAQQHRLGQWGAQPKVAADHTVTYPAHS